MDSLYSKAIRLAGSAEGAEYLVQQTYASDFGVFEPFDSHSDFNKWLNEILMRTCLNTCFSLQRLDKNYLSKGVQIAP